MNPDAYLSADETCLTALATEFALIYVDEGGHFLLERARRAQTTSVDGRADLNRARRIYGALPIARGQARGLEWQIAMIQDRRDSDLRLFYSLAIADG